MTVRLTSVVPWEVVGDQVVKRILSDGSWRGLSHVVSSSPPDCQDVQDSEEPSSLASTCEGNDGIQMFLSLTRGAWGTHKGHFDIWNRCDSCLAAPSLSESIAGFPVSASVPGCAPSEPVVCVPRPQLQESRPQSSAFCVLP